MESFQNLREILESLSFRECSLRFYEIFKSALVTELIEEVEVIGSFENFYELDNMRWIDIREDFYFIKGAFLKFGVFFKFLNIYDLDSNLPFSPRINTPENLTILTFSNLLMQRIVLDYLYHYIYLNDIFIIN